MCFSQRRFVVGLFVSAGLFLSGVALWPAASGTLRAGEKKDEDKKKEAKKDEDKKPELKKDDDKKFEAKKDDKPAAHVELKTRLKKYDADIARIRADMIKECEAEEKKIDDALAALKKEHTDANKAQDYKTAVKINVAMSNLRVEKMRIGLVRGEVERKLPTPPAPPPPRVVPPEERLGIHTGPVSMVVAQQLGLPKDQGIVIERVDLKSPADKAGLKQYDILIKLDGKSVPGSGTAFRKLLAQVKSDTAFDAVVVRQGKEEIIKGLVVPDLKK